MPWIPIWPGMDPRPRMKRAREEYLRKVSELPTVRVGHDILAGRLEDPPFASARCVDGKSGRDRSDR